MDLKLKPMILKTEIEYRRLHVKTYKYVKQYWSKQKIRKTFNSNSNHYKIVEWNETMKTVSRYA